MPYKIALATVYFDTFLHEMRRRIPGVDPDVVYVEWCRIVVRDGRIDFGEIERRMTTDANGTTLSIN